MQYDPELVRAILRKFGSVGNTPDVLHTDGMTLSPPAGFELSEDISNHVDRLVSVGIVRRTNEIHMTNHSDPATLRATEAGRRWVRAAYDDDEWNESVLTLRQLLSAGAR